MIPTIMTVFLICVCTCAVFYFGSFLWASLPACHLLQLLLSLWSQKRLLLLRKRDSFQIVIIVWLHMNLNLVHTRLGLMRMFRLVQFLQLVWRIGFLLILWSLSGLIRYGPFFEIPMSPPDSLLFLLLFIRSSFFIIRVMLRLMLSSISSLLFSVRSTLLVLSCLMPPVSHALALMPPSTHL
jgi:hypothetical protein